MSQSMSGFDDFFPNFSEWAPAISIVISESVLQFREPPVFLEKNNTDNRRELLCRREDFYAQY